MSGKRPDPDIPKSNRDLEAYLRKLDPTPMDREQVDDLVDSFRRVASATRPEPSRLPWGRVIPLTLLCLLAMVGYGSYHYGPRFEGGDAFAENATVESSGIASPAPRRPAPVPAENFVPVSAQGFLVKTSSSGVVETTSGPAERVSLEFRDAYHWHDPETGTNIRYFQPRNEEVVVPFQTD